MSSLKLLLVLLSFLNLAIIEAQENYFVYHYCSNNKTFTANSSYQFNLKSLLSTLSSATIDFYNATAGSRTTNDDTVFGLFMCRGDVPLQLCRQCVQNASERISSECRYSKEAIIWYEECLLRYSNFSFFSTVSEYPTLVLINANETRQKSFNDFLAKMLAEVAAEASNSSRSPANFAIKGKNISASETLYTLAQCTPDLSSEDCDMCLRDVMGHIPWCCLGKQGGRVLYPSCELRFELYQFYRNVTDSAPAPTPSANTSFPILPTGERKGKSRTIIMAVLPIFVSIVLLCFCCYILQKRRKKSYKAVLLENFGDESATVESLQFNLGIIEAATNKFSQENMIGKGGFGEVYKGILTDGRVIAVKRLSKSSGQEYAMFGQFSEKSDVFSFGVMILEIISGKKNANSYESRQHGLLSYAWTLWRDDAPLEILDPNLKEFHSPTEVTKCIQIGLLCVQENPNEAFNGTSGYISQ
ncbi:hypothetical protein L6164_028626 [Bauhinia variegata]|uniref:Uncharacterized protein n=1 Tax=Bauhinia variegata TaxID=167791 RepID=A0ACB9L781_BAUVA|nr:hypothetical protein L6164_028626 [Bauhinia variegata]